MNVDEILAEVRNRNVELFVMDGRLKASPPAVLPTGLKAAIRERASEIKSRLCTEGELALADQALELLNRLKGYTIPSGQMPAVHALAVQMRGLADPGEMLSALQNFDRELIGLGGEYDCQLAETIALVERTFPGARLS